MLISKEERPNTPENFRPISLFNIIYKIISKVIANALKPIMNHITSKGNRFLIVAHESMHSLKSTKKTGTIIKLDMSKAFDRLIWDFLLPMLAAFKFCQTWIHRDTHFVSSTFFVFLINGSPSSPFNPSQGIRQGDPLSPFLFILIAKGLGSSVHQAIVDGNLKGLCILNQLDPSHIC